MRTQQQAFDEVIKVLTQRQQSAEISIVACKESYKLGLEAAIRQIELSFYGVKQDEPKRMSPRKLWKGAWRFTRALESLQMENLQTVSGLYPSWLPRKEYDRFLEYMTWAKMCRSKYWTQDDLGDRMKHAEAIKELQERLYWCEQTTMEDVKRLIRQRLKDLYHAW